MRLAGVFSWKPLPTVGRFPVRTHTLRRIIYFPSHFVEKKGS